VIRAASIARSFCALALLSLSSCNSCEVREEPSAPAPESVDVATKSARAWIEYVPAGQGDVPTLVKAELARARQDGVRLVVYTGATWCEPCRQFHEAVASGALDSRLPRLRFLEFDLDRDEQRLTEAGYGSEYIPMFAIPGEDGRSTGKFIQGSIKDGAAEEITPRLLRLLAP
jgi:hypothetical protein